MVKYNMQNNLKKYVEESYGELNGKIDKTKLL